MNGQRQRQRHDEQLRRRKQSSRHRSISNGDSYAGAKLTTPCPIKNYIGDALPELKN
jgi:hypothetical protein